MLKYVKWWGILEVKDLILLLQEWELDKSISQEIKDERISLILGDIENGYASRAKECTILLKERWISISQETKEQIGSNILKYFDQFLLKEQIDFILILSELSIPVDTYIKYTLGYGLSWLIQDWYMSKLRKLIPLLLKWGIFISHHFRNELHQWILKAISEWKMTQVKDWILLQKEYWYIEENAHPLIETYVAQHKDLYTARQLNKKFTFDMNFFEHLRQTHPVLLDTKRAAMVDKHYDDIRQLYTAGKFFDLRHTYILPYYSDDEWDLTRVQWLIKEFGEQAVFDYLWQWERDPHNAVLQYDQLMIMYETLYGGERKSQFINTILKQSGQSEVWYVQLNEFLEQYTPDRKDIIQQELDDPDGLQIEQFVDLAQLVMDREVSGELYRSRQSVYQIGDLMYLLSKKSALKEIDNLARSHDPDDQLRHQYFLQWILSPRKKDVQAMLTMYTDPDTFLWLDDGHAHRTLHQWKKPKNMVTEFDHLDMDAKDLIDSQILWVYDELSYFKPMEMSTIVTNTGDMIHMLWQHDISMLIPQIRASRDNRKKSTLVKEYNNTAWKKQWDTMSFKAFGSDYTLLPQHQQDWIVKKFGCKKYTAKISPKSDISNRYNGFNCDRLSMNNGKKVVMMFNPHCTDFCLYKDTPSDDVDNLVATSRLTLNKKSTTNFVDLKKAVEEGKDPRDLIWSEVLEWNSEYFLTLDNIEADPNFASDVSSQRDQKNITQLKDIYTAFFGEYIKKYALSPNQIPINTKKILCGKWYQKIQIFDTSESNDTLPIYLNSYTDNFESTTYTAAIDAGEQQSVEKKIGIHPMSIEDVYQIIYLEWSIYPVGIKEHAANIQHEITASIINNSLKWRKDLSMVYYKDNGKMWGYCLAYPGVIDKGSKESCVYVKDLAVQWSGIQTWWWKLVMSLFQSIEEYYPDYPIVAELRADTSYPIVIKMMDRYGYEFVKHEESSFNNGEKKYDVIIQKKKA